MPIFAVTAVINLNSTCPNCDNTNRQGAKFCNECGLRLTSPSEPLSKKLSLDEKLEKIQRYLPDGLTEKILFQRDRIEGERRQITIMFCDMKGFTPLTEKLGPDETFSLVDQVFEILIHKVNDYQGTVNELRGDGILAFFGAPIALEDAPQRAIRSALAIHREMTKFNDTIKGDKDIPPVLLRIGINTGPVVVGFVGNDLRVQFTAVGDPINIASRIEQMAEPGTIYVTEETFKLTGGFFRFEALGTKKVKGKEQPMSVYRVIAPSSRRTRFDISAERGLTPFVGRERELELLLDGFESAKAGRGQAISIISEAGVGKSRLLYEFRKAVANENATFLEGKCLSYSKGVAYHPAIDILKANFDIDETDRDLEIREKIIRGLKILEADEATTLPYLLELLSITDSGIDKIPMSPEERKDQILEAIKQIFLKGSEIRPLIIAFEDLHWIDKSSEDVLKYVLESIPEERVLIIFTYRPEFVHTWGGKPYHSQVNLNRLSNRKSLAMVAYLLSTEDIEKDLEELILEKTEGVPFFIEEFVKSLKDLKIIDKENNKHYLARDIRDVAIPSSIQDVVMARVDSLPEGAKKVLQIGSVIGREFGHKLIKEVSELPEIEMLSTLSILKESELIYESGIYPQSHYIFKHALTQNTVYKSLMKSTRQKYHRNIAQVLEESFPEIAEMQPELLSLHFTEAGFVEQAIPYCHRAGEISIRRSANLEAVEHMTKGLNLITALPETQERMEQELNLRIALGTPLIAVKGWAAPEVEQVYVRARELCQQVGDPQQHFSVLRGLWHFYCARAKYQASYKIARELLRLTQKKREASYSIGAHRALGADLFWTGNFTESLFHQEKTVTIYEPEKHRSLAFRYWTDPKVHAMSYMPLVLWPLGFLDRAAQRSKEALTLAHELPHLYTRALALFFATWFHSLCRDFDTTIERAETLVELSIKQRFPIWLALGSFMRGWALVMQKGEGKAISQMREDMTTIRATGMEQSRPFLLALLAEAQGKTEQAKAGLDSLDKALALVDTTGERCWEAELHRLKGELLLTQSMENQTEAESSFNQALDVARHQKAKFFELRAAMSMSRTWESQGRRKDALQILAPIYGWFTEGFDPADLKEAKALLEKLG
jgi:class 3 adenylate cyclase/predicted ATPase